jgi:predicted RNase H-like HicB family nuclease
MAAYIALLRKDGDSDFGVDFPDFPGCVTAGRTLEEAHRMAAEALTFHIESMVSDGEPLPEPSSLDTVMTDRHIRDAVAFLVEITRLSERIRVSVMLPENLIAAIDRMSSNRSRSLAEPAR